MRTPPPRRRTVLLALCAALLASNAGRADAVEDLLSPRTLGVGESLRADASGALGPMLNPSGMALSRSYTISAMYGFDIRSLGSTVHLSIVDSATSRLATGVYYNYLHASPKFHLVPEGTSDITHSGSETGLAFGIALGDYLTFGLSLKYLRFSWETPNPAWNAATNPGVPQTLTLDSTVSSAAADGFTMDTGITLRLGERFNLAAVGYNLVPLHSIDAPLALGVGAALKATEMLTLAFDSVIYFDKYQQVDQAGATARKTTTRLGGGIEWLAGQVVPLRVGALWDSGRHATFLTAGLGFVSTSFALDVGYRQQVSGGKDSQLVLGLRVFLQ